jgi:hypothetical protein
MKILLLVLTAIKYPERIAIKYGDLEPFLGVYKGEPGKSVMIAELELEDFLLNDLEQAFVEAAEIVWEMRRRLFGLETIFDSLCQLLMFLKDKKSKPYSIL